MARFSLTVLLAVVASSHQANAFQAGPASRVSSRHRAVAVETETDVSFKIPTPQALLPGDEQRTGAMMDLSGVVMSVSDSGRGLLTGCSCRHQLT